MYKLSNEEFERITGDYGEHYNKIKDKGIQIRDIVSRFLGQVLLQNLD
ncbi:hypothetical protein CLOBY_09850 [Clostridium saccharobutylicum]|uniref:Uncharacterized protein n=1 Tax=Clostridium saccharobutylicum DSM 13864 TaxID=1345695 RepID=U5MMF3_CLOSA|nr:hypothetical protein CLSA_c09480 [Clostridium saccharobutylicum DSM 13864]AQR89239.1 hypothetical protein CLOSC_09360 [Clostridium saccharobutylicum]AQR99140.1 hypothetical protein CSACC_09430 [Clostridium saccharobutylicum]AQS08870.1 hypothetical protein CLOBY_09850 [Clostridium saccharobutylicum]AQS13128.1 hypothetical protein CLOSACC_09430 [Clostridium saccharobutylicum]